jgi:Peptidase S24-like.
MSHTDKAFKEISKELLQKGVIVRFPVSGGSMRPFLRAGDVVSVTGASHNSIHPGDIVLHSTRNDTLAVHRVIAKKVKIPCPGSG